MKNEIMTIPYVDWNQIVANGGPPCFAIPAETPNRYCCRAERWEGHGFDHDFISFEDLLTSQNELKWCREGTCRLCQYLGNLHKVLLHGTSVRTSAKEATK